MVGRITRARDRLAQAADARATAGSFPCRDGVFNIGVGLARQLQPGRQHGRLRMQDVNLRQVFDAFCELYAPARELMAGGTPLGELKGAPLRCSLDGALYSRARPAGHRRGHRQHLRLHRRRHRQGHGDRHARGRSAIAKGREQQLADAAVRADYEAATARAEAALRAVRARPTASTPTPGWPTW